MYVNDLLKLTLLVIIFYLIIVEANILKHNWSIVDVLEVLEGNHFKENDDCDCGRKGPRNRILNGQNAGEHEFPWQVYIEVKIPGPDGPSRFNSGGSFISMKHILTAAHSFYKETQR
jgi:hypothetical protein